MDKVSIIRESQEAQKLISSQPWFNRDTEEEIVEYMSKGNRRNMVRDYPADAAEMIVERFSAKYGGGRNLSLDKARAGGVTGAAPSNTSSSNDRARKKIDSVLKNLGNVTQKDVDELSNMKVTTE